jgi:hypothetical protein
MLHRLPRGADPLSELGRAQRMAVERARQLGRHKTTVRLCGGRDLEVLFVTEPPVAPPDS